MLIRTIGITLCLSLAQQAPGQSPASPLDVLDSSISSSRSSTHPESFYVASYEQNEWTIIDVQPASIADTRVRFIKAYASCGTYHVRETDQVFEGVTVADLAGKASLCAPEKTIATLVRSYRNKRIKEPWPDDRRGTSAQCGSTKIIHRLPSRNDLRYDEAQNQAEDLTALWDLEPGILQRYSKLAESGPFKIPIDEERRIANRRLAEHAAIQIRNGDFDAVLPSAWSAEGPSPLSELLPDPNVATSTEQNLAVVENIDRLDLEKGGTILYPMMAVIANIQGEVTIRVEIDPPTGNVVAAKPSSGHPLLGVAAVEAIKPWRFVHPYYGPNPLEVIVHYDVSCPFPVETQATSTKKIKNRSRKKTPTAPGRSTN
jgi:TonB family protein